MADPFNSIPQPISYLINASRRLDEARKATPGITLAIQLGTMGPYVYGRKGSQSYMEAASWEEIIHGRTNPLDAKIDNVLRLLNTDPTETQQ